MKIQFCTNWKETEALERESFSWISDCFFYSNTQESFLYLNSRAQLLAFSLFKKCWL